jgi:polyhydroxyalkanoate synthesis regulator phasin
MHSINGLRQTLGLTSANQVRNRIEAIKDLLIAHIRRGPNNQILLTDAGAELLRRLQELHDNGLTMTEASEVLRSSIYKHERTAEAVSQHIAPNAVKPDQTASRVTALREEVAFLRQRVAYLEARLLSEGEAERESTPWWHALREEIDAP